MFSIEKFASALSRARKAAGLSQTEIAARLYVTPQTVSKWENGRSVPTMDNLALLAEILSVSADDLINGRESEAGEKLLVGIDGGGTKTEFCVSDLSGNVRSHFVLSASNPNVVGIEGCISVLSGGIGRCLAENGGEAAVFAGIAGCGSGDNAQKIQKALRRRYAKTSLRVASDIENVFGCRKEKRRALAVICGTGTVVYAKDGRNLHRAAGYGYLFDGAGSGYDIGHDCIRQCLLKDDGLCEESLLTREAEKKLGGTAHEKLPELYKCDKNHIASFAPVVFGCAAKGDGAAAAILRRNFGYVKSLIDFAREKYGCGDTVLLSGGLCAQKDVLVQYLSGDYRLEIPDVPPVYGALANAAGDMGKEADEEFLGNFRDSYVKQKLFDAEDRSASE